ncbi:SDR family oxidoreductase [Oscillochloris sp. ZM17-4]|uniref:SDR family NAD(P)-dependent oxidoreductase n=1 Tax=Oscillochloris sp. ZM17-4 TaxID=2866714 RepID=UPI001C72AF7C|nr:SDR family NAD(P)-dependent oxidoreductase [Oscillochloris sp. ZM17-4]MBX0328591.1 SDR family oxidoreductase [Oscillochloris sp. ZM17-4]
MNLQLEQKRVLITGSTGGIGAGLARHFAAEGAYVIVNGRHSEAANAVATAIRDAGGQATVAVGDLMSDTDVERVVDSACATLGGIDILVNNAAAGCSAPGWSGRAASAPG